MARIDGMAEELNIESKENFLALWITIAVVLAGAALAVTLGFYFWSFHGGLSDKGEVWAQFGDFFGGTVNPVLGFLTIIALALTLILQSKQLTISARELALSREELQLTRQELSRSAHAQELSEQALRAQAATAERSARLTATNFLLEHYGLELEQFRRMPYIPAGSHARVEELQNRKAVLTEMIDTLFVEISGENDGRV